MKTLSGGLVLAPERNLRKPATVDPVAVAAYQKYLDWAASSGGWSQTRLATESLVGRAHLNQVLTGVRSGGRSWPRIVKVHPMDGLFLLKQCVSWNKYAQAAFDARVESERQAKVLADIAARCRQEDPA